MPFDIKSNPLLTSLAGALRRDRAEHITPAIDALLQECRSTVALVTDPATPAAWPRSLNH